MLFQCWASVEDGRQTLKRHWVIASCVLGHLDSENHPHPKTPSVYNYTDTFVLLGSYVKGFFKPSKLDGHYTICKSAKYLVCIKHKAYSASLEKYL